VQQLQEAEGYRACPADQRAPYLLRALVHDSTLSRAADCLGSALGVVNRALKRHAASTGNVTGVVECYCFDDQCPALFQDCHY
jgi:hypothetical protein